MTTPTLLEKTRTLGHAADGYRLGGTGPSYYDCSGLVYTGAREIGCYLGFRFTTGTIAQSTEFHRITAAQAGVDDIVVWRINGAGHMGVVSGPDRFYSAHSVATGIVESSISGFHAHPVAPYYLRLAKSDGALHGPGTRDLALHDPRMAGIDVERVQEIVEAVPDRIYGPDTALAVGGWQHAHGLRPDRIVGPDTRHAMGIDR